MRTLITVALTTALLSACGTWVGNPKPKGDDDDSTPKDTGGTVVATGGGGAQNALSAQPGGVLVKKVFVKAGTNFHTGFALLKGLALADGAKEAAPQAAPPQAAPIELSVLNPDGTEAAYTRSPTDAATVAFTPEKDIELIVTAKNNTPAAVTVDAQTTVGADSDTGFVNAEGGTGAHKDLALKAVVTFAKQCKKLNDGGSVDTVTAPGDEYFVQPFVFLGKVGADKKVTPLAGATIVIKAGAKTIALSTIDALPRATFTSDRARGTDQDKLDFVKTFYQGYFGAAGQMYTTDTFHFGGDCAKAVTVDLGHDVGTADVQLTVEDATQTPALSLSAKIRPTASVPFSVYAADDSRLNVYTNCAYDAAGEPNVYGAAAGTPCLSASQATPPYVKLDYKLPSAGNGYTAASDPTRILFYGSGQPKVWKKTLAENFAGIQAGTTKAVTVPTCLFNGGLVSVPVSSTDKIALPVAELNAAVGDIVNMARKAGSYTALTEFYQGNADGSGKLSIPSCVPNGTDGCAAYARLDVTVSACSLKADSGISVPSVGDNFIYPDYYDLSAVVAE